MYQNVCSNLLQKNLVYRSGLHKSVCNLRNILSDNLCLVLVERRRIVLSKKGITFCRSISVKKFMKLVALIFEQSLY